jgi:chaperonin GroES
MATKTATATVIRPLEDRVVVRAFEAEERTSAGIYLPGSAQEKPMQGEVIAAGPGRTSDEGKQIPLSVKKGDTVIYGKYSGTEVEVDGEKLIILRESELLGKAID